MNSSNIIDQVYEKQLCLDFYDEVNFLRIYEYTYILNKKANNPLLILGLSCEYAVLCILMKNFIKIRTQLCFFLPIVPYLFPMYTCIV